jgi:hypothetical protein
MPCWFRSLNYNHRVRGYLICHELHQGKHPVGSGGALWSAREWREAEEGGASISLGIECDMYSFGSIFLQVNTFILFRKSCFRLAHALVTDLEGMSHIIMWRTTVSVGIGHKRKETRAFKGVTNSACAPGFHIIMLVASCKSPNGWRSYGVHSGSLTEG